VSEVEIFRKAPNDRFYYGRCRCGNQFNYDEGDVGRTVRCRYCHKLMKLIKEKRGA
jgi:DNA-directed RNA polymerase subunit RPC12/RpoP